MLPRHRYKYWICKLAVGNTEGISSFGLRTTCILFPTAPSRHDKPQADSCRDSRDQRRPPSREVSLAPTHQQDCAVEPGGRLTPGGCPKVYTCTRENTPEIYSPAMIRSVSSESLQQNPCCKQLRHWSLARHAATYQMHSHFPSAPTPRIRLYLDTLGLSPGYWPQTREDLRHTYGRHVSTMHVHIYIYVYCIHTEQGMHMHSDGQQQANHTLQNRGPDDSCG